MIGSIDRSLSRMILIVLTISVAAVMAAVILLTLSRITSEMIGEVSENSEETAAAISASLKFRMAIGDSKGVEQQLLDIREKLRNMEVFVCDPNRRITFSTDHASINGPLDERIPDAGALNAALVTRMDQGSVVLEHLSGKRYFVHVTSVPNQEECYSCHGSGRAILGAIVLKKDVDRNFAAITDLRNSNILISMGGIVAIVLLTHLIMRRLIIQPIEGLADDIRTLPVRISNGGYVAREEITRNDEIGTLQRSFQQMATELDDKAHALEQSNQDLAAANKELEAFAYSVSHDLRAPLRNIDGFSKILIDDFSGKLGEKGNHYLSRVRNGTARMSALIDDMLSFSRIGRTELQRRCVRCADIIKGILDGVTNEIRSRNVSIHIGELPEFYCDPAIIQSLFSNLISNALKFTRHVERPEIVIGYDGVKDAVFVKDNGVGFDVQYHDKIFQVFQRLHLPEEYEGTGIGLAIVKRIAERHSGRVWAEAEQGKGASFFVQLPRCEEA